MTLENLVARNVKMQLSLRWPLWWERSKVCFHREPGVRRSAYIFAFGSNQFSLAVKIFHILHFIKCVFSLRFGKVMLQYVIFQVLKEANMKMTTI